MKKKLKDTMIPQTNKEPIALLMTDTHLKEDNIDAVISVFEQAIKYAKKNGFDRIYGLGDNFHSRKTQSEKILHAFSRILDMFEENHMKYKTIVGNHDKTDQSNSDSFLTPFKHHPSLELISDVDNNCFLSKEIWFYLLSYFPDEIYLEKLNSFEFHKGYRNPYRNVLLTHTDINGFRMNGSKVSENHFSPELFSKFDKVLVGHYHDNSESGNITYIGASLQHNYGETEQKGFTVLYDDLSTEIHQLGFPRYKTTILNVSDLNTFKRSETYHNEKIIIKGTAEELSKLNKSELQKLGVDLKLEIDDVEKIKVEDEVVKIESQEDFFSLFEAFCDKYQYSKEEGIPLLSETLSK